MYIGIGPDTESAFARKMHLPMPARGFSQNLRKNGKPQCRSSGMREF